MSPSFIGKIKCFIKSIKQHLGPFLLFLVFILFGSFFVFIGNLIKEPDNGTGFIIFGAIFILVGILAMLLTLPSSIVYYYEKELVKKYGAQSQGTVIKKYTDTRTVTDNQTDKIETETDYLVDYCFSYQGVTYNSTDFIDSVKRYKSIKVGDTIKVKFLRYAPSKSSVVKTRLKA